MLQARSSHAGGQPIRSHRYSFAAIVLAVAGAVQAQAQVATFDIASGPAGEAVAAFAQQSQRNILAAGETLGGVTTNAVQGKYGVDEALARLLAGTGLASRPAAGGAIVIMPAPAPVPATAAPAAPAPQVVTVTGTRHAVATAIDLKKRAPTVTDAVAAEDVGQFPDKNIGEALSRITGVQVMTDFGEGNQIAIRGVQPDLNRIEINGMTLLSTAGGGTRAPELRELPAELIKSIEVVKGATADMTEGGLGGTVLIRTNRPFDFRQFTVAASAAGERNSLRGGTQPRASLLVADRFAGGRLGLMANVVYDKVLTEADRVRDTGWRLLRDWDFSPEKTVTSRNQAAAAVATKAGCAALAAGSVADCEHQWYDYSAALPRYGLLRRDHARATGEFTAQYALAPEASVWTSFQRSSQRSRFQDLNYVTDFSVDRLAAAGMPATYDANGVPTGGSCVAPDGAGTPDGVVVNNHHVTQYVLGSCLAIPGHGGANAVSTQARDFGQRVDTYYRSTGFQARAGQWDAEGMLVNSRAEYANDSNFVGLTMAAPGLKVTLDAKGLPHFTFPDGWDPGNAAAYTQVQLAYTPEETTNWERQARLDLRYRTGWPFIAKIAFGFQGRSGGALRYANGGYTASAGSDPASAADDVSVVSANTRYTLNWDPLNPGTAVRPATVQPFSHANDKETWGSAAQMQQLVNAIRVASPAFLQGADPGSFPAGWTAPSVGAALPLFDTATFNHDLVRQAPGSDGQLYAQLPAYRIEERIRAAHIRLDLDHDLSGYRATGNIGLRYAHTRTRAIGRQRLFIRLEQAPGSASYDDHELASTLAGKDNAYGDFLPSLNGVLWLRPDTLALRVGYAKVMARPSLDQLAPNLTCMLGSGKVQFGGDGIDSCSGGNPDLKPYRAANKDLALEWYANRDTQLSVAYFRKDITRAILNNVTVQADVMGNGTPYYYTTSVNSGGATNRGIELAGRVALSFLPGLLGGFGVDANVTRMAYAYAPGTALVDRLTGNVLPFPGLSKTAGDVALWYDRGRINARLAYNYRTGYYTGSNDASTGNPIFAAATGFLDAKVQYRLSDHVTVAFEAKNLADEVTLTSAGAASRPIEYSWSGRRYFLSLAGRY
jgi:iron complex outermembrane receptor protein